MYDDKGMRFIASGWNDFGPYIMVTDDFLKLHKSHIDAAIWHEVGHIHHEHIFKRRKIKVEEYKKLRTDYVLNDKVVPFELEADMFAVSKIGPQKLIRFLEYTLATRPQGDMSSLNDIGARELKLRIKRLKELAT